MIRWLRGLLPGLGVPIAFAVLCGGAFAATLLLEWRMGARLPELRIRVSRPLLLFATFGYAAWRVLAFHPYYHASYRSWLAATPWTSQKPLPLGPIHLDPRDVLVVGVITMLAWLSDNKSGVYCLQLFLFCYAAFIGWSLFFTGAWPWGYAAGFGLGALVWLWPLVPVGLLVAVLTYAVAFLGLRISLARFPWEEEVRPTWVKLLARNVNPNQGSQDLGWPFRRLAPGRTGMEPSIPVHHALLTSVLVGWWVFAAASHIPDSEEQNDVLAGIVGFVAVLAPLFRLAIYCDGHLPPISFAGRLATGRWIIPGYDQVFVAPLLALASWPALGQLSSIVGLAPLYARPATVAVVGFITLAMGPSLKDWRLTGAHRIVAGSPQGSTVKVG
jgi:hypothetical protein